MLTDACPERELNLYLVRHGQTEGNVRRSRYLEIADHAIKLTRRGHAEALHAGRFLAQTLGDIYEASPETFGQVRVWHSPYYRTRQTAAGILYALGQRFKRPEQRALLSYREEPFITEQKAGLFSGLTDEQFAKLYPDEAKNYELNERFMGRTYSGTPLGESRMQVVIRVKHHFRSVLDDYKSKGIRHVILVSHGVTVRAYEMGWMRYAPEWLDAEANPGNCWVRHIHGNSRMGYVDEGYIHGKNAPLRDPLATQRELEPARRVIMLKPQRPSAIVPKGVKIFDPFEERCAL